MKDSNTASDIDYQSMVKNIIDDFTSPTQIAADDSSGASNETSHLPAWLWTYFSIFLIRIIPHIEGIPRLFSLTFKVANCDFKESVISLAFN